MATEMILILLFYPVPGTIMWQKVGVIARKAISLK